MFKLFVGMPVYNGATHIGATIESLLDQTYRNFQLVISDNCSTDATEQICRKYASYDNRVQYTRMDVNKGATCNYNHLVENAL